jgi:CD2 antigen cytoplasmic tail-binding protein 2
MSTSKRPHPSSSTTHPSKKPRFSLRDPSKVQTTSDSEDEPPNAELEADVIGSTHHARRGAVNIDGFDSDSDGGDNFDTRAAAKASVEKAARRQARSKDEEDADMFADLEEDFADGDEDEDAVAKRKKDVKFLDGDKIEGQVKHSRGGGHVGNRLKLTNEEARYMEKHGRLPPSVSSGVGNRGENNDDGGGPGSSSESEVDDEARAALDSEIDEELGAGAKTKHAPKLDAFNMRDEQDEGRFDESGNFVRKAADPDAVHDRWLDKISKKDMKKAREAHEKRETDRRKRDLADDGITTADALGELISRMERGETVLEALARLGKNKEKKKPAWKKEKSNGHVDEAETQRRANVEAITSAADLLLTRGNSDIYDSERELLVRLYNRESGEQWREPNQQKAENGSKRWEYRWTDARDGGNINGPYDSLTMRQWNDAGYFGEGVEFRADDDTTWTRVADFS